MIIYPSLLLLALIGTNLAVLVVRGRYSTIGIRTLAAMLSVIVNAMLTVLSIAYLLWAMQSFKLV